MKKFILVVCCVCFLSCKKESISNDSQLENPIINKDSIKENSFLKLKDASVFAENWSSLLDFKNELENVKQDKINSEKQLEQLINLLEELKKSIPEKFNKPTINARVVVLETELLLMNQFVKDANENEVSSQLLKLQASYNVLINQLEALLIKEKDYEKYK